MLLPGVGLCLSLAVFQPRVDIGVCPLAASGLKNDSRCDSRRPLVICIDPGHSKKTVGAVANGLKEYVVCWQVAKQLEAALKRQGDRVVLTKANQDENVSNEERALTADREEADLFIRLHCDTAKDAGIATFYPATQGHIRDKTGPGEQVIRQSRRCARAFHAALIAALAAHHSPLRDRGVRTDAQTYIGGKLGGALEGSIYSTRPVLLVEMCVLNASGDARFIRAKKNQKSLAEAMAAGVQAAIKANNSVP
jgi:N-acetylmuramoyl-L-alanine amidase